MADKEKKEQNEKVESDNEKREGAGTAKNTNEIKIEALEHELEQKAKEASEYLDTLQRLKAEFENFKKRIVKEQSYLVQAANEDLVLKLLPAIDNFERALYMSEEMKEHQKIFKGIEMIYAELLGVLEKEGLAEVEARGDFNPEVHEAVMQVSEEGYEENQIVDVLRKGYRFKSKLVRPAMVKVQSGS